MTTITAYPMFRTDDVKLFPPTSVPRSLNNATWTEGETVSTLGAQPKVFTYEKALKERLGVNAEIQAYENLIDTISVKAKNFSAMAKNFIQEEIRSKNNLDIDPDKVFLHKFDMCAISKSTAFTGWEHDCKPTDSCTLTELVSRNFDEQDQSKDDSTLNLIYGVYHDGPGKNFYGAINEVPITASDLRKIIWDGDFYGKIKQSLNQFWTDHENDVRIVKKAHFITAAIKARSEGSLSEADFDMVMKGGAPHIQLNGPVTKKEIQAISVPDSSVSVRHLDINGYASNDILLFKKKDNAREILYVPDVIPRFHVFNDDHEMRRWVADQGGDADKRAQLLRHFSLYQRQDGIAFTGVETGLKNLGSGAWPVSGSGINSTNTFINIDVFDEVVKHAKARSFQDAETSIKSNSEVKRGMWLGTIRIANQVFGPLFAGVGGLSGAVIGAGAFASQFGLEIIEAVRGDSESERRQAAVSMGIDLAETLIFGVLTSAPKEIELPSSMDQVEESNDIPYLDGLPQRLHRVHTEGISGRGAIKIGKEWAQQTRQQESLQCDALARWDLLTNAEFHFANPRFGMKARIFLNQVMDEGLLIDETVEKKLTEFHVIFENLQTADGTFENISSRDVGFDNFVHYQGKYYLRYLDRLFLVESEFESHESFVIRSTLAENRVLCKLAPELNNGVRKSVVFKEPILEKIEEDGDKIVYYGINDMKHGNDNAYQYLMASLRNAEKLLRKARERLGDEAEVRNLERQIREFGIHNLAENREQMMRMIDDCHRYISGLMGASGDRVIAIENRNGDDKYIAFTLPDQPVPRIYLHERYFHSPALEAATTLIHEASHLKAGTDDLWYDPNAANFSRFDQAYLDKFEYGSAVNLRRQFQMDAKFFNYSFKYLNNESVDKAINSGMLQSETFLQFFNEKMNKTGNAESAPYTLKKALKTLNDDSSFKTSAILRNADSFSHLVEVIASPSYFKGEFTLEDPTVYVSSDWVRRNKDRVASIKDRIAEKRGVH